MNFKNCYVPFGYETNYEDYEGKSAAFPVLYIHVKKVGEYYISIEETWNHTPLPVEMISTELCFKQEKPVDLMHQPFE